MFILDTSSVPDAGQDGGQTYVSKVKKPTGTTTTTGSETTSISPDGRTDNYGGTVVQRTSIYSLIPHPNGSIRVPPVPQGIAVTPEQRDQVTSRILGLELLDPSSRSAVATNAAASPNVRNADGPLFLVPAGQISPEAREGRVRAFIQKYVDSGDITTEDQELLEQALEFEKERQARSRAARELDLVFAILSSAFPDTALKGLLAVIGYLKDPLAISTANSGIASKTSEAIDDGRRFARAKGDTSLLKSISSILNSGFAHASHVEGEGGHHGIGGLEGHGGESQPQIVGYREQAEPVYLVDQHGQSVQDQNGNPFIAYWQYYYEPVYSQEEHDSAHGAAIYTLASAAGDAHSAVVKGEQDANQRRGEMNIVSLARNDIPKLEKQIEETTDPRTRVQIDIQRNERIRNLGLA